MWPDSQTVRKARVMKAGGFLERHICEELELTKDELSAILQPGPAPSRPRNRKSERMRNLYANIAEACGYAPSYDVVVANFGNMVSEQKLLEIWCDVRTRRCLPRLPERQDPA